MSAQTRGLGRGLDALLGGSQPGDDYSPTEVRQLRIVSIVPNKHQPRAEFSVEALEDLCTSIKSQGVLQPILVRPLGSGKFELVAGERRLRASKMAGLNEIPGLIREMSDEQSLAIALIENLQREDLNAIEEARGFSQLMDQFGLSQEVLAEQVGKSRSSVANALRLLRLPSAVQKAISEARISAGHGRAVMALESEGDILALSERVETLGLSVRQAEAEASYFKLNRDFPETEAVAVKPSGSGPTRKSSVVDEHLVSIKDALETGFGLKVAVSGTPAKGKITFKYSSSEELTALIERLGVKL